MSKKEALPPIDPVDIDSFMGRAKQRIDKIGIELEGGWVAAPRGVNIIRDGSVAFTESEQLKMPLAHVGELPSPPLSLDKDAGTYFEKWLKVSYPHAVNQTCGMHVHMSLKNVFSYNRLMTPKFQDTVISYIGKWATREGFDKGHPIWHRLAGNSEYCQRVFAADAQARVTSKDYDHHRNGHRYTIIHYCYGRLGTVECRLLPMMTTVEQAAKAIHELLNITNGFLLATAKNAGALAREEKLCIELKDKDVLKEDRLVRI